MITTMTGIFDVLGSFFINGTESRIQVATRLRILHARGERGRLWWQVESEFSRANCPHLLTGDYFNYLGVCHECFDLFSETSILLVHMLDLGAAIFRLV